MASLCVLALFAVLREIVILRGEVHALTQVITRPPEPAILGALLPATAQAIGHSSAVSSNGHAGLMFTAFLSSDCGSCRQLVLDLQEATQVAPDLDQLIGLVVTVRAKRVSALEDLISTTSFPMLRDDGTIARQCDVRGTPMLVSWSPSLQGKGTDYTYGGSAEWVLDRVGSRGKGHIDA